MTVSLERMIAIRSETQVKSFDLRRVMRYDYEFILVKELISSEKEQSIVDLAFSFNPGIFYGNSVAMPHKRLW